MTKYRHRAMRHTKHLKCVMVLSGQLPWLWVLSWNYWRAIKKLGILKDQLFDLMWAMSFLFLDSTQRRVITARHIITGKFTVFIFTDIFTVCINTVSWIVYYFISWYLLCNFFPRKIYDYNFKQILYCSYRKEKAIISCILLLPIFGAWRSLNCQRRMAVSQRPLNECLRHH